MLYSRLTARKLADERVRHYDVTTLRTRTSASADKVLAFKPGADIAIANAIACYLVENDLYDKAFVADHLQFKQGTENIGNAFEDGYDASEQGQSVDAVTSITFEEYAASSPRCSPTSRARCSRCGPWASTSTTAARG